MSLDFTDDQSTLVQVMAWCHQATSRYLIQYWPRSLTPYGVTRPQWVKSLWPSDAIWWCGTGSALTQVMACCLKALSITWNNVDLSSVRSCGIHLKELLYPRPTKLEGGYTGFTLSVRLSVCPSVCRRHGFRSISQVCFGISISNFICMLMVAIGRSLLIFSDVTFKMAAWRPYWIFWFPDSNFTLALNINFKLQRRNTYVYG